MKFNGKEDYHTGAKRLDSPEEAYREIGQTFSDYPAKPTTVALQTKEGFPSATGSPAWADSLCNPHPAP
jgi:hypothetical protein